MGIIIDKISKSYDNLVVFKDFSLELQENKISCILGPSGCGKTTLLNIIGGLDNPDSGKIIGLDGKAISYLFQEPRLIKWKTVWDNIDFVIKDLFSEDERKELITGYLDKLGLMDFKDYYPDKLSGGMMQRAAMARAFVYPADMLIMDEPFKGLDLKLKISIMKPFLKLWMNDSKTVIFVTHDIDEALYLGDETFVFTSLPANIKKKFNNDIPREQREFKDSRNYKIEKDFFKIITR